MVSFVLIPAKQQFDYLFTDLLSIEWHGLTCTTAVGKELGFSRSLRMYLRMYHFLTLDGIRRQYMTFCRAGQFLTTKTKPPALQGVSMT
jgi:hypothetical protein